MGKAKNKILFIDDDEIYLIAAKEVLKAEGYEVITHLGWFGAANMVKDIQPDLVLLDVNMPGFSGNRLSLLLLSNYYTKNVPVVFYSSDDEDRLRKIVAEHGVKGHIRKGDILELKRKLAYYLDLSLKYAPVLQKPDGLQGIQSSTNVEQCFTGGFEVKFNERCHRICGTGSAPCFINNKKHIYCISDMVVNKICAFKAIVDMANEDDRNEKFDEYLDMASENVGELVNWIRYLQGEAKRR